MKSKNELIVALATKTRATVMRVGMFVSQFVCMSVPARDSNTIAPIDFLTQEVGPNIPLAGSSTRMILIGIRIRSQTIIKGLFAIARQDRICHQSTP